VTIAQDKEDFIVVSEQVVFISADAIVSERHPLMMSSSYLTNGPARTRQLETSLGQSLISGLPKSHSLMSK
jgi:hypothetical protein